MPQFRDKTIYRLTEPEAAAYKQVAVLCVRRSRQEREKLMDLAVQQGNHKLRDLTRLYEEIPAMPDSPDRMFAIPMSRRRNPSTEACPSTLWKTCWPHRPPGCRRNE
jgi:hypothetical protein